MTDTLESIAQFLVAPGKGLLAADESFPTIAKRFAQIDLPSNEENRRNYREMLFTTPGLSDYISGVILFDETIRQYTRDGMPFPLVLEHLGIIPGIKVDTGKVPLANFPRESVTEGLDGLRERLAQYRELGARFTKWRAAFRIGSGLPTTTCLRSNAELLARFAALSQETQCVPIVEPEVLIDGDHTLPRCEAVTMDVLAIVFDALRRHGVQLEGMLLKPNMVLPGTDAPKQASADEVADATLRILRRTVPAAVPGIVFLSGGQSSEQATLHLNAINQRGPQPWQLSFSFGRALENPALSAWKGNMTYAQDAQHALYHQAHNNSLARNGNYTQEEPGNKSQKAA